MFKFDPDTPGTAAVYLGRLNVPGSNNNFSNGDIAFDGVGNLTGAFSSANMLAIFLGQYDAQGNYTGISLSGQKFADQSAFPRSLAFLPDGDYLLGDANGNWRVNTNTGAFTQLADGFQTTDFASCAAPSPEIIHQKTAELICGAKTITYTITVENTGGPRGKYKTDRCAARGRYHRVCHC